MDLDQHLHRVQHLDCSGRISHTLTLLIDGTVEISFADGRRARLDPASGTNLTPDVHVPPGLVHQAGQLRPW
ncbi:MAG: hypothetical protein JNK12_04615 [Acidimicrobiales bacterium]|nr:hypothetical protein [Acidimicrobiales bacterium]